MSLQIKLVLRRWGYLFLLLALILPAVRAAAKGSAEAKLFITRIPTAAEAARRNTHALYEPAVGCYLGAFIDFDSSLHNPIKDSSRTPHFHSEEFEQITGKPHAMYFFYMGYGKRLPVDWVRHLAERGKFVHIALEPNNGLKYVRDDAYLRRLCADLRSTGAKIFLRFASEMNGDWTIYHRDPAQYRAKFRLIHKRMKQWAPNVATVWCPYTSPERNIKDYYPGDDGVDWVGVNMYSVTYHNNQLNAPAEFEHPNDLVKQVYNLYSARKPMMICEFAATHFSRVEGRPRPDFAMRKILTLYNALPRLYPRVKCINYFDGNALQYAAERASNDYSVTDDRLVNAAYQYSISSAYFLPAPLPPGPQPLMPIPMPMKNGELLRGQVRLSCWARAPSDFVKVRYLVNGYKIYEADRPDLWECIWDAGSLKPGKHRITLEAINTSGKVTASQTLIIQTRR